MTYHQPGASPARQFAASSKATPCPICGRTKDGDCRFRDGLIMCHQGATSGPPAHLQPGDVITVNGQRWALVSRSGGYSGCAAVFRPCKGLTHSPKPQDQRHLENRAGIARATIHTWLLLADQALAVPEFEHSTLAEINVSCDLIHQAHSDGLALQQSLEPLLRQYRALVPYRELVAEAQKQLGYQWAHALWFRREHLGEVVR